MKVKSFDGFRFFLITLVFVSHCNLFTVLESTKTLFQNHLTYGGFCVEIFFTLSGFCIYLDYNSKFKKISGKDLLFFLYKRFSKLYPAYILSNLICFISFFINDPNYENSLKGILNYLSLNYSSILSVLFMVQAWNPSIILTGNAASWFISSIFFCYLLSPFMIFAYNRIKSKCNIFVLFVIINVIYFIVVLKVRVLCKDLFNMSDFLYGIFAYSFPVFKLFNFLTGIPLCNLFLEYNGIIKEKIKPWIFSVTECALIALLFLFPTCFRGSSNLVIRVIIYTCMIFVFAMDKGIVSKFFSTETSKYLGSISLYFYLFHYPIVIIPLSSSAKLQLFFMSKGWKKTILYSVAFYIVLFILSLFVSFIYSELLKKLKSKPKEKLIQETKQMPAAELSAHNKI